ncbi:hypothetical protein ACIBG0_41365 [Nocardia sp. NPDC050630]|uniref:hypothetical protein n=1 Tax=Nocardia sp. NPDC050630 TaxID=3364321 RepID=UPI0037A69A4A
MTTTVSLRQRAADYLVMRRTLGYKLVDTEHLLTQFLDHLERSGTATISTADAVAWASAPPQASPQWRR